MDIYKLSLLIAISVGFLQLSSGQTRDCSGACTLQARCNPYHKDLFWAVVGGVCRVFQNGCFFGSANCQRANQCLRPMVATSPEKCKEYCPQRCPLAGERVCGWFAYVDVNGVNRDRSMTFPNRCLLDQYACRNGIAYIGEPSVGSCP